jgi:multiple sugar transport system ATP-binding protein
VSLAEPMGAEVIAYFPLAVEQIGGRGKYLERVAQGDAPTLTARLSPRSSARTGERIRLAVDVERLHFFDGTTEQAVW